jgi:hypothetical protein
MGSENPIGADNQQGRLQAYLSGFVDGEGSFSVGVQRRPDLPHGFQLVPEFRVSQNAERSSVLVILRDVLGCGRILENHRGRPSDRSFVLVVRRRTDLLQHVIPFFERNPLLSEKHLSFVSFAEIVRAMARGEHLEWSGFERLVRLAFTMNGEGRYRRWMLEDVVGPREPSETARRTRRPGGVKIQSELHGDMQNQAEMTWSPAPISGRG